MANLTVLRHPLIQEKLTYLRDKRTTSRTFRSLVKEIAGLMVYEITKDLPIREVEVETPLAKAVGKEVAKEITLVPIIRAGIEMMSGMLHLIPHARVGHMGIYRDEESLRPIQYYEKFPPNLKETKVFVIDPMLATGGSALGAIEFLKEREVEDISFICLLAAPEGVEAVYEKHPEVPIFAAALDERLNERGYIVPGLGDAGDRLYRTI
ncbi:MAG: uracil phosphoribosyltransferase [Planctomycetota bacterium]|nr:MAG: uracil phosphoribosyltransferase [Planctomycetota bacterium]